MRGGKIIAAGVLSALALASVPAFAQPAGQPIRMIFPFAAGGSGDALARIITERIGKETGRGGIVENRTGASGRIGVNAVKNSPPDGGTLLITAFAPMSIFPLFYGDKLGYDPDKDFTPISQPVSFEFALAASNPLNVKSVSELAAALKKDSAKAVFGTPAAGALPHFLGLETGKKIGVDLRMIVFRGSALGINDLVAGQLPLMVTLTPDFAPHHEAEKNTHPGDLWRSTLDPRQGCANDEGNRPQHCGLWLVWRLWPGQNAARTGGALQQDHC